MAGIFDPLGFPFASSNGSATDHGDGGRHSKIDDLFDDDGPIRSQAEIIAAEKSERREMMARTYDWENEPTPTERRQQEREAKDAYRQERKKFQVTERTRLGGTGLYRGRKE